MSDSITVFFDTWQLDTADVRLEKIASAVTENVRYDDPRTSQTVSGIEALSEYVGVFSANAPGWTAKVVHSSTTAGMTRATVVFEGVGPDGKNMSQLGQYYVETEDDRISRMVGFVGTGTPEQL